jgi:hypothetical protein
MRPKCNSHVDTGRSGAVILLVVSNVSTPGGRARARAD